MQRNPMQRFITYLPLILGIFQFSAQIRLYNLFPFTCNVTDNYSDNYCCYDYCFIINGNNEQRIEMIDGWFSHVQAECMFANSMDGRSFAFPLYKSFMPPLSLFSILFFPPPLIFKSHMFRYLCTTMENISRGSLWHMINYSVKHHAKVFKPILVI